MLGLIRFVLTLQSLYPHRLSPSKIKAKQELRLRSLLAFAVERSPYYRRRFAGIDVARCALTDLPTLTKAEMMENFDDLVTDRRLKKADLGRFIDDTSNLGRLYLGSYAISHTSGSQGQPAIIVQDCEAINLTFAVRFARGAKLSRRVMPHIERLLKPARMAVLTVRPGFYPSAATLAYLPKFLSPALKVLHLTVSEPLQDNIRRLEDFRPDYIVGYASGLADFGREQEEGRMRLRELGCLKQLTNLAEPLPDATAEWLERVFDAHVSDEYAMGECLLLSSGDPAVRGAHVNSDFAILEVVDENNNSVPPGVEGSKVLVTNLYNNVQPFIRYEADDRITMSVEPCPCGSILPHIAKVSGRTKDKLWIEEGGTRREMPYYVFLVPLHHILDLSEHQIVQTGPRNFLIRVVSQPGKNLFADRIHELVMEHVRAEDLQDSVDIQVEIVPDIPRGPSGKILRVKNEYAPTVEGYA